MKKRPLIALLTDFGESDGYVAAMKGVLLSRCPAATLVDLSHAVARHDIRAAAYFLWSAYREFPKGTVFLAVVDPGVGSRRALACTAADGYYFVHPDNGILDLVLEGARTVRSVELTNSRFRKAPVSPTFHGRDILAPAAAAVCAGTPMSALGKPRVRPARTRVIHTVHPRKAQIHRGSILHIDHFGNMITNFSIAELPSLPVCLSIGRRRIRAVATHYDAARAGTPFLLVGSSRLLEVAVPRGSAARALHAAVGTPVRLTIGGRA